MTYTAFTVPGNGNVRDTVATTLTSAGLTRSTQGYVVATNYTLDVWKSPAASNAAGQDWYLLLLEWVAGGGHYFYISVCEGWDDATKLATRYSPAAANVTPAADFSVGATGVAPTVANIFYVNALNSWTHSNGAPGVISATVDRVILRIDTGQGIYSFYAGHLDRVYPTSLDPVQPLVATRLDAQSTAPSSTNMVGATTRDPGATVGAGYGFRIINCTSSASAYSNVRQLPSYVDGVTGKPWSSRCGPSLGRWWNNSLRGIYKDLRIGTAGQAPGYGDTMTETLSDGSTVTYWLANNQAGGYWALAI